MSESEAGGDEGGRFTGAGAGGLRTGRAEAGIIRTVAESFPGHPTGKGPGHSDGPDAPSGPQPLLPSPERVSQRATKGMGPPLGSKSMGWLAVRWAPQRRQHPDAMRQEGGGRHRAALAGGR